MRNKDENKKEAILNATIQLTNEIGYANVSMSKIAKLAGVSASTLYTYYDNKEDMFTKVYVEAKVKMLSACGKGISKNNEIKQSVRQVCQNLLSFISTSKDLFLFIEQSSSSPLITESVFREIDMYHKPIIEVFEQGIKENILKETSPVLLIGFCFYPITQIYKEKCLNKSMHSDIDYDLVFDMCWDAVKK